MAGQLACLSLLVGMAALSALGPAPTAEAASFRPAPRPAPVPAPRPSHGLRPLPAGERILDHPLRGVHRLTGRLGDPRAGGKRRHAGVDLLAPKMTPVVAVADGTVARVFDGRRCCAVSLRHDDGWSSRYIHLNNDTPGTDDGRVRGIVPGLEKGSRVRRGDLLGWVGDSGNAEHTAPHLHFELLDPDGRPVDPQPVLELLAR